MIRYAALKTPSRHLEVRVEPPDAACNDVRSASAATDAVPLLDTTAGALRASLLDRLKLPPHVVLTGHQVEFLHGGVLAKLLALQPLSRRLAAAPVFLSVDSDTPKSADLAVPVLSETGATLASLPIPDVVSQHAVETQRMAAPARWAEFFDALRERAPARAADSLEAFRAGWLRGGSSGRLADAFFGGHAAILATCGHDPPVHLRISTLSETPEFRAFLAHWLIHARPLAEAYNRAQARYRARHGVRSPRRPVPPLNVTAGKVETPFWAVSADGSRARLSVGGEGGSLWLFADESAYASIDRSALERAGTPDAALARAAESYRIRPRALALSAAVRLLLSDLFIHGIGGAKYDEMTDDFMTAAFGRPPRSIACISATLRIAGGSDPGDALAEAARLRRELRDAEQNPQRRLASLPADLVALRAEQVREIVHLRERDHLDRAARRNAHRALRETTAALRAAGEGQLRTLRNQLSEANTAVAAARVAGGREYFYALGGLSEIRRLDAAVATRIEL